MVIDNLFFAFALTVFAGLSTGIGSALALLTKSTNTKFLSVALGFSAGVMIYVSMIELFDTAKDTLIKNLGISKGSWLTVGAFFAGILLIAIIDKLVPSAENPHEVKMVEEQNQKDNLNKTKRLMRMGLMTALIISVHNFPEGIATFASALKDPNLGIAIAAAIAIHNIPEGIAVSIPIYFSTGDKKKAFIYSFLSGLSEPVGALIGYVFLYRFFNDIVYGFIFAAIAGVMVFISLDELLPTAREYGEAHLSIYGVIAGMMIMAVSLILFI